MTLLPGPMQFALSEMLEDTAWVDAYLAQNLTNLAESYATLAGALAAAGIPFMPAAAGMFVWIDLGRWLKEPTWEEEAGTRTETLWHVITSF